MRFKLFFELENNKMKLDYRRSIVSFIKKSLCEYDKSYFDRTYHDKDPIVKPYTFAVFFNSSKFTNEGIYVNDKKFNIIFSTSDYEYAIVLYNAFNRQKNEKFSLDKNSMRLVNIEMLPEKKIESNEILIKLLSPLVVKSRLNNKDTYYAFDKKEFYDYIGINIKNELIKISKLDENLVNNFKIIPIQAKKVIVKNYDINLECSIGKFKLCGNRELLEILYKTGIGAKRSLGFGCFQIINE